MEPISFALALGAIPSIFTSCVDCYRYVEFGRDFEKDFGLTLCKLEASELRLTRWGATMGLEGPNSKLSADLYGEEEIKSAYHWLQEIEGAFSTAFKTSSRSKSTAKPEKLQLLDTHAELTKGDSSLKDLHGSMRRIIDGRLKPRRRDRVAWALYKKGAFDNLVENLSELVNNLVELFPSTTNKQEQLCKDEVKAMSSDGLKLLSGLVADEDVALKRALENELRQRTIHVGEVQVREDFVGQIGDNVEADGQASSIDVRTVDGSGNAMLHIGSNIGTRRTVFEFAQRRL